MIKVVYILRARDDVDVKEVHRYWRDEHAPKMLSVARTLKARRYIQSHTIDSPLNEALIAGRGMAPFYEGITEVWWDSLEDLEQAAAEPEGAAALQMLADDEATFIDLARSTMFLTEEVEIFDFTAE